MAYGLKKHPPRLPPPIVGQPVDKDWDNLADPHFQGAGERCSNNRQTDLTRQSNPLAPRLALRPERLFLLCKRFCTEP
jgi:hypothetical protein